MMVFGVECLYAKKQPIPITNTTATLPGLARFVVRLMKHSATIFLAIPPLLETDTGQECETSIEMGRFRSTTKALERWGAMSFDRIEALQISADQTKVGAHIATKNHLIEIDKRSQRDDDAEAIFYEKRLGFKS